MLYLIGGAPGAGKSTLGRELATRVGATSLSADDLLIAAKAATTAQSHPGLHVMSRLPSPEYFTTSSLEQLKADATLQHDAMWPVIESVVRSHSKWPADRHRRLVFASPPSPGSRSRQRPIALARGRASDLGRARSPERRVLGPLC